MNFIANDKITRHTISWGVIFLKKVSSERNKDTNVAGASCTYDRIIVTSEMNAKFSGEVGVIRFDEIYELDCGVKVLRSSGLWSFPCQLSL